MLVSIESMIDIKPFRTPKESLWLLIPFVLMPVFGQDSDSTDAEESRGREIFTSVDFSFSQDKGNTDFISKYYSNKNYNYFLIGIDENDPLCHSMKNFRCFTYDAIVYLVDYSTKIKIEDRIKYLEISRL